MALKNKLGITGKDAEIALDKINITVNKNTIPYDKRVIGTREDIKSITKEELYTCYDTFYHPSNMVLVVCGDFNVAHTEMDIKNAKANIGNAGFTYEERGKFSELLDAGFIDTFRYLHPEEVKYSWWSYMFKARQNNAGWRMDYFLVSESLNKRIQEASIHADVMGSDHCPVSLELDIFPI